jgi:hypothetical protein
MDVLSPEEVVDLNYRLDHEWDLDRWLHLIGGAVVLLGLLLGRVHSPRWRLMSGIIAGGLVGDALVGWCPTKELLQRTGVRSRTMIEHERYSLLAGKDLRPEL